MQLVRHGVSDESVLPGFAFEENDLKWNHRPAIYCRDNASVHADRSYCSGSALNVEEVVF